MFARTYLVTGGTGFIGSRLVRSLLGAGHSVRVIDNDLRGRVDRLADIANEIELIQCDVRDVDALAKASKKVDSVLHLAALNGTENFYKRPQLVLDIAVRGMLAVLECCKDNGIPELVLASSSEVYQMPEIIPTPEDVPMTIPDPWNPRYSYGGGKLISELMLANYYRDHFERVLIFRPHNVYGPDMGWEHVLPQLVIRAFDQIKEHSSGPVPFKIQGDGSQTRSFIYIDDFIDAVNLMLKKGEHRNIYHLGTSEEVQIRDVVNYVFEYFERGVLIIPDALPEGGTPRRCPDISKISDLGFEPEIPLKDGIKKIADWYVDNQHLRPPTLKANPS